MPPSARLRVVLLYAAFAALWVLLSDTLLGVVSSDPAQLATLGTLKGWAFVAATSLLLFALLKRNAPAPTARPPAPMDDAGSGAPASAKPLLTYAPLALAIGLLGLGGVLYTAARQQDAEVEKLQNIADLKVGQLGAWLAEREADARFMHRSRLLAELAGRWRGQGDRASREQLRQWLDDYRQSHDQDVLLLDARGELLLSVGEPAPRLAPPLSEAAARAVAEGRVLNTGLYRGDEGRAHLDFVAPLPATAGSPGFAVVLRVAPERFLFPFLQSWPAPSASGETLLFRRDGDQVLFLNELRHRRDTALKLTLPLDDKRLLAVQVAEGRSALGRTLEGVDYRAAPVLGVARAVAGTDWFLVAKVDKSELRAGVIREARWIVLADLLALFIAGVIARLAFQRRELAFSLAERRHQAERLHALQLLDAIAERSTDAIFAKDREGRYLLFNRAAGDFVGQPPAEVLGRDDTALFPPDEAALTMTNDRRVMAENRVVTGEETVTTAKGLTTFLSTKGPLHDAEGSVVGIFGIARDISERKEVEEQLRKLWLAVEQSPDSIVITDRDGDIEYVNQAFTDITGYPRQEVLGKNPRLLRSGRTPPATYRELWATLGRGETWKGEFCNRRRNGEEMIALASISPVRQPDGRISHYLGIEEDITEKKAIAAELERHRFHLEEMVLERTAELAAARTAAEAANRAKSAFLANMSHEIRTPMNAIIGLTHLLRRHSRDAEQQDKLRKMSDAAQHLLSVINDILDLSKIEAGKLTLDRSDFTPAQVLEQVAALIHDKARAKGLALTVDLDPALARVLRGDPTRLGQALLNYAANAVKFTDRGAIVLAARLLEESDSELLARFEVRDTGIGIAADAQSRLFAAFEQADSSTTRKYGGSGLGLAIARRLAQLMGGEAGVDSRPGSGSTFWLNARFGKAATPPEAAPPERRADALPSPSAVEQALADGCRGARLLLVEDNPINQEVALDLLREAGLTVDLAGDGAQAVAMARQTDYDLILMDIQMPVLDGIAATRAIRALPGRERLPILAMTASAFDADRQRCLAAGMNDHVGKPVDPDRLFASLLQWLPKRAAAAAAPPLAATAPTLAPDWPAASAALARLETLLAEDDARAGPAMREALPLLAALFGEAAQPLARQIERFDYAPALATLRALRAGRAEEVG